MKKCSQNKVEGGSGRCWQTLLAIVLLLSMLVAARVFIGVWAGVILAMVVLAAALALLVIRPRDE